MRDPASWSETVEHFAAALARVAGMYGVNPLLGRLYGVLFLATEPMTLGDLADAVGAAKSTVSVAMRKLESAHLVRRHWRKGDRRDWYEAASDPNRLFADLARHYFEPEMLAWSEAAGLAERALEVPAGDAPPPAGRAELLARIEAWNRFGALWSALVPNLIGTEETP